MTNPLYHTHTFTAGQTGVKTFPVSPGRRIQIGVKDKGAGGVYDLVNYLESAEANPSRELWKSEIGLTGEITRTSEGGFKEIGINLTAASSGDVVVEVLEVTLSC